MKKKKFSQRPFFSLLSFDTNVQYNIYGALRALQRIAWIFHFGKVMLKGWSGGLSTVERYRSRTAEHPPFHCSTNTAILHCGRLKACTYRPASESSTDGLVYYYYYYWRAVNNIVQIASRLKGCVTS